MKTECLRKNVFCLRGLAVGYIGFLILLPIAALGASAFHSGPGAIWRETTLLRSMASLKLTFILALMTVILNIFTGTATAWVLVRYEFPCKKFINGLIDLPFAIPTVVTGIMLVVLYGPNSMIGAVLGRFGLEIIFNQPGIVLALLFVTFPFVIRAVQPVLIEMEKDLEEAAMTLGASPFQIFFKVVLPTLLPAILTGAALSFSRALGEFGSVVIVAGNIPFKTLTAPVYIYGEIESGNLTGATSVSLVLLTLSFSILVLIHFIQRWSRCHETD